MPMLRLTGRLLAVLVLLSPATLASPLYVAAAGSPANPINHVIVIYQENWSFDSLYGEFPGAHGPDGASTITQTDPKGQPYALLPQPWNSTLKPAGPDPRFPANLPVQPFDLGQYVPADQKIGDLPSGFYQEQAQIDGGKMDQFVARS